MSSDINRTEFTDVGELRKTDEGLAIFLNFGKALQRVTGHLIGKKLEVSFKPLKYQRSQAQNRWLWGVAYVTIVAFLLETEGVKYTKDEIHAYTLKVLLGYHVESRIIQGQEVLYMKGKSTSQLSTAEFSDLVDLLQSHWAEFGCIIESPKGDNFISDFLKDE